MSEYFAVQNLGNILLKRLKIFLVGNLSYAMFDSENFDSYVR